MSFATSADGCIVKTDVVSGRLEELHRPQKRHYVDRLHNELEKRLVSHNPGNKKEDFPTTYQEEFGERKNPTGKHYIYSMPKPKHVHGHGHARVESQPTKPTVEVKHASEQFHKLLYQSLYEQSYVKPSPQKAQRNTEPAAKASPPAPPTTTSTDSSALSKSACHSSESSITSNYRIDFENPRAISEKLCELTKNEYRVTKLLYNIGEDPAPTQRSRISSPHKGVRELFQRDTNQNFSSTYKNQFGGRMTYGNKEHFVPVPVYQRTLADQERLRACDK